MVMDVGRCMEQKQKAVIVQVQINCFSFALSEDVGNIPIVTKSDNRRVLDFSYYSPMTRWLNTLYMIKPFKIQL